ncbi:MAG: aminotransferase class III-fold pyridoxal phosphate-dependent enzyme [Pseudomonadota bacterium]
MDKERFKGLYRELFTPAPKKVTDLVVDRGEGMFLHTIDGDRYLDFVQGVAVNALGHCHPDLTAAAVGQMTRLGHASFNLVSYPSALIMAERLRRWTGGLDKFFFTNTGAEVVESGIKLSRVVSGKGSIIAFRGSFHGRTMGAASVTGSSSKFRKHYAPFVPQVYFAPYPYCFRCPFNVKVDSCSLDCLQYLRDDLEMIIPAEDVAAVLFEPVMGEGGYVVPPVKYVRALAELCRSLNIYLMFDEVQTGMGRTGKMFACRHFDLEPDILLLGKAVGGGYPLAVLAAGRELMDQWPAGSHGSTFGGHPAACAAGAAQLEIIGQPGFLDGVLAQGEYFRGQLMELKKRRPEIGDARGLGLMNAIELVKPNGDPDPDKTAAVIARLFAAKILVYSCGVKGNIIRFMPPLNVERSILDRLLEALEQSF